MLLFGWVRKPLLFIFTRSASGPVLEEHHTESLDHVWGSYKFNSGIVCGDFNLPNISWTNGVSGLEYNGSVTDKVRQIGDQYGSINWDSNLLTLTAERSAAFLQRSLLNAIEQCVPMRTYRKSSFPQWVTKNLKNLLAQKNFKKFGGAHCYYNFSLLRACCKFESKKLHRSYLCRIQERLRSDPRSFWDYARKSQGCQGIPEEVHLVIEKCIIEPKTKLH
ncbi:hypothetical protein ACI65C_011441 [Semiaphis heraclei]